MQEVVSHFEMIFSPLINVIDLSLIGPLKVVCCVNYCFPVVQNVQNIGVTDGTEK